MLSIQITMQPAIRPVKRATTYQSCDLVSLSAAVIVSRGEQVSQSLLSCESGSYLVLWMSLGDVNPLKLY